MHIELGSQPTSADSNISAAVSSAMQIWNSDLASVQFVGLVDAPNLGGNGTPNDGKNEIFFSNTIYGKSFGP
jgi:hypothetical protein